VYYYDQRSKYWEIGRVVDHVDKDVFVRFPNSRELRLQEHEVHVRWRQPLEDPTAHLATFLNETPRFAEARSKFVQSVISQRTAFEGMAGLASSNIEIEPHQYRVVKRVLHDHMQRYMLADEVGLGKTIEAGILIRQHVLDHPHDHNVLVVAPTAIVDQWENELVGRFHLAHWLELDSIDVVGYDDVNKLAKRLSAASMIVIDEAHYLSELYKSTEATKRQQYERIRKHALRVNNLLLLTATPVTGDDEGFLCVLHLLDPVIYKLDDLAGFAQRISNRQNIAESVATLVPENLGFMGDLIPRIEELFPDDRLLLEQLDELKAQIQLIDDPEHPEYVLRVQSIRHHLAETYRLHRRILRNRRAALTYLTPQRAGLLIRTYSDDGIGSMMSWLDGWREKMLVALSDVNNARARVEAERAYCAMLECLANDPERLSALIEESLLRTAELKEALANDHPEYAEFADALAAASDDLRALATSIPGRQESTARYEAAMVAVGDAMAQGNSVIAFCSTAIVADRLHEFLKTALGAAAIRHRIGQEAVECDGVMGGRAAWVMVCDRDAEEGLNLQGGHRAILHYDLPFSPNRIEQRTGRVDRYGKGGSVNSITLACDEAPTELLWAECLRDGFGVFHRSVASLQYYCAAQVAGLVKSLFATGGNGIAQTTSRLAGDKGETAQEFRRINSYDALEALQDENYDLPELLEDVDSDWESISTAVKGWAVDAMRFRREHHDGPVGPGPIGGVARFQYRGNDNSDPTLLSTAAFLRHFAAAVDPASKQGSRASTYPYAPRRLTALGHNARVLRIGDSFLDELEALTKYDDRGRVFAMWRHYPNAQNGATPRLFFKFDFVIEADIEEAIEISAGAGAPGKLSARASFQRRADALFSPLAVSVWLTGDLLPVSQKEDLALVLGPYRPEGAPIPYRDYNLNPRRWQEVRGKGLAILNDWGDICEGAAVRAREIVKTRQAYTGTIKRARKTALTNWTRLSSQMEARIAQLSPQDAKIEKPRLKQEELLYEAMCRGFDEPNIRIDTIGAVFVSRDALSSEHEASQ
jgi:ATP-dependent helicase HepA